MGTDQGRQFPPADLLPSRDPQSSWKSAAPQRTGMIGIRLNANELAPRPKMMDRLSARSPSSLSDLESLSRCICF